MNWRRLIEGVLVLAAFLVVAYYGGQTVLSDRRGPVNLVVYGFSTQEEVLTQSIFPAFEREWEAQTGRKLTIEGVFGPSGTLASQIVMGAPADIALLSNQQHVNWLKASRQVSQDTQAVVVSMTPMVLVTRPGNPRALAGFGDLAQPDLNLLHADPHSSGAGDWALLAVYGSEYLRSNDQAAAEAQVRMIWSNVRLMGSSARSTLTLFELGAGDALITYEQDARLAQARGVPLEVVVPARTIVAEHVAVLVDENLTRSERPAAVAFLDFLLSNAGQQAFIQYQLRPVRGAVGAFPPLADAFTVRDLGGWSAIYPRLVEDLWVAQIEPRLELDATINLLDSERD